MSLLKIIAVLGPTASGKSDLAVEIALKCDGEVVSADSRQVYRGLDIATGKITAKEMCGIPHHLLGVAEPHERYSVAEYKRDAEKAIDGILSRGKLPILCGGTGLYIQAIVDNILPPKATPDEMLRKELTTKSPTELFLALQKLDPRRAKTIDAKNQRRLIRAIEIVKTLGSVPPVPDTLKKYDALEIGIRTEKETLKAAIKMRLDKRLSQGMIEEARQLRENGLSFERMEELGLEYRYLAKYLQKKITLKELEKELSTKIWRYAKRQMTWFKRDPKICWFSLDEKPGIFAAVKKFLKDI